MLQRESVEKKWRNVFAKCQLMPICPKKAEDKIGEAATSLFQVDEYPGQEKRFLGLAYQSLYAAEKLMQEV